MKFKIVVDSSSNLKSDYIKDNDVGFEVVPLTIRIDGQDFVDDDNIDVKQMLTKLSSCKDKPSTSCPSPASFAKSYEGAEYVICLTISSKLSGCFNSAFIGGMDDNNSKIHVIDSLSTSGSLIMLVDKAYELIKQGLEYEQICEQLDNYVKSITLLFVLDKFDNLVRNGRMSKLVAFVATSLSIKPICIGENGEIKIFKKVRSMKIALKSLVSDMASFINGADLSNRTCIVSCIYGDSVGQEIKKLIEETYPFKEVRLVDHKGLCAFYALENGLIVTF